MSAMATSSIVFLCVFGGAVIGARFRRYLPEHHLNTGSHDVVKLAMGLVATMSALVLGLLVSSAKNFYDTQSAEVTEMSSKVVSLDRVLAHYGPEAKEARDLLRGAVAFNLDKMWPQEHGRASKGTAPTGEADVVFDKIQALSPTDDKQRMFKTQALSMAIGVTQTRWLMYEQGAASVSAPMLAVLVFWLTALFVSFGLFAPLNATVITAFFISGLSVSGAIFLILEMYTPFGGLIEISSAPLRFALAQLGK